MPYYRKRRYYRRRRNNKKRGFISKATALAKTAYSAYRGVRYLKGLVNSELFKLTLTSSITPDSATGSYVHLTYIPQGDDDNTRSGNSIFLRYIFARCTYVQNASATNTFIRQMLICDTQQVADTAPSISGILQSVDVLAPLNADNVGRYKVLSDTLIVLNSNTPSTFRKLKKSMRHHVRYNGTAATDIQKGGIYVFWLSNQATNTPTVNYNFRMSYHDN